MKKFSWILLSTALLAACGTATTSSGSTGAAQGVSSGGLLSYPRANAGSNVNGNSDVNHVNLPAGKPNTVRPVAPSQPGAVAAPAVPAPGVGVVGRCGGGAEAGPAGNRLGVSGSPKRPLTMCAVE
ncbi:MAG: hypothetical protein M3077_15640 [Candidatus Dormibacteraeota bacterium]|nr:hypothetical protein [Candidatus Dormibacteraeota bacterium]